MNVNLKARIYGERKESALTVVKAVDIFAWMGERFFIHKTLIPNPKGKGLIDSLNPWQKWSVSEYKTGLYVDHGRTKDEAKGKALSTLNHYGIKKTQRCIKRSIKNPLEGEIN